MRMLCPRCDGKGANTLNYHSGERFDVALCDCPAGQILRRELACDLTAIERGVGVPPQIARRFGVSIDRIWPREDLVVDSPLPALNESTVADDALLGLAGQVGDRAGLGGKVRR